MYNYNRENILIVFFLYASTTSQPSHFYCVIYLSIYTEPGMMYVTSIKGIMFFSFFLKASCFNKHFAKQPKRNSTRMKI